MSNPTKATRKKAIEIGMSCACLTVRKSMRTVTQLYDKHLARVGMRITQFTLLNAIAAFGKISIHALATELVMDRTTLTRNLKPLIKSGWIDSTPDEKDARVRNLTLTGAGMDQLSAAFPHWEKAQSEFLKKIDEPVWNRLTVDLTLIDRILAPGARPSDKFTSQIA